MYKCNDCEERFLEPVVVKTTYEMYLGIDGGNTPLTVYKCPYCGSEEIIELEEKENE
jgi:DNA-directed RNA polymerase subunit RPC12/RpoP